MKDVTNVDSNSKSGDTLACGYCGMPMTSARHLTLHIGMAHPPIKAILPEPPQDTTIQDVVNGTPKGQAAVEKAIKDSIEVQNSMTKKAQDTSLDFIGCCGGGLARHEVCSHVKAYIKEEQKGCGL